MAVDPDSVVVTPTPMPWNPDPVNAADVIARPTDVIRPVTNLDVHNDRIYHGCHCCEHCQKYPNFQLILVILYRITTNAGGLLFAIRELIGSR